MAGRTDTGSNALFNENLGGKRKHVACIQDMEEVEVVLTVHMIKGGIIELPVLQCLPHWNPSSPSGQLSNVSIIYGA